MNSLSNWEILSNSGALQILVHSLCKGASKTDQEFNIKYDVFQSLTKTYSRWGYGGQGTVFLGLTAYCVKGYNAKLKLLYGLLYVYWINHFYTLGSFIGVSFRLPWAFKQLYQIPEELETGKQMKFITKLIKERTTENDSQLNSLFYASLDNKQTIKPSQLVQNDYFIKHREYVPEVVVEELKLPIFDSYLTRYPYFTFYRWASRFKAYLGIEK